MNFRFTSSIYTSYIKSDFYTKVLMLKFYARNTDSFLPVCYKYLSKRYTGGLLRMIKNRANAKFSELTLFTSLSTLASLFASNYDASTIAIFILPISLPQTANTSAT